MEAKAVAAGPPSGPALGPPPAPSPHPPLKETVDPKDTEITRLRRRLRTCQASLRAARSELAKRPPAPPAPEPLTGEEIRHLHKQFARNPERKPCEYCGKVHVGACETCGGLHAHACPRVRAVEYEVHGDNVLIRRVEYWAAGRWSTEGILFPTDLPPLPEN